MKLKTLTLAVFLALTSGAASAYPLSEKAGQDYKTQQELKSQMDKMIMSVADLDIMQNRTKEIDYGIMSEDAKAILEAVKKIRELDNNKIFSKYLRKLEQPAKLLLKYSEKKDPRAQKYPDQIFNACFNCHKEHRKY